MSSQRLTRGSRTTLLALLVVGGAPACATHPRQPSAGTPAAVAEAPLCESDAGSLGTAPLRRLTRLEYGRTLNDLTGVDASVANELPPDEKSLGFDDMAEAYSVSTLHASQYLEVAERVAESLVADTARLTAFAGCDPTAEAACVERFVAAFGRRAYRRPLSDDERTALDALYAATATPTASAGVTAVVAAILQAPQFLYRPEPPDGAAGYALATRLSYLIVASAPDEALLDAASAGELDTSEGLAAQADRLLASPRAGEAFSHFVSEWWELDGLSGLQKDQSLYRTWTAAMPGELARETQAFLDEAWRTTPTLATLLGAPVTFVDATLAGFYGLAPVTGSTFARVELDPTRAAGLLTQGSFLAVHAKANQTSPVQRGKFVREKLLCDPPPPPPPSIVVKPPTVDPRLSTRERFAAHTADPACAGCHSQMDPIGFLFEHYDAVGRFRDIDGGKPVDSSGYLQNTDVDGDLDGVPALAERLLESAQVRSCVARQWFRYAFGRDATTDADTCTLDALSSELERSSGDLRAVMRATVEQQLFRAQRAEEAAP